MFVMCLLESIIFRSWFLFKRFETLMSQARLALASAVGTSVLTTIGWQSSSWLAPAGPLCRAAAALLDQALLQRTSQTAESPMHLRRRGADRGLAVEPHQVERGGVGQDEPRS